MKKVIGLFLVLLLGSSSVFAQETKKEEGKAASPARFERMIKELNLDDKQAVEFRKINEEFRTKMMAEREAVKDNRDAQIEKVQAIRAERDEKLQKVMTKEQFEKFKQREERAGNRKGAPGRKPGGPR